MPPPAANRWLTFSSLSLMYFVVAAGAFSSLGVVLPAMVKELGWSWTEAGLGYTLLGLACGLASFLPAVLIPRIGVRGAMAAGALCMTAGFGAMAATQAVGVYLAATVLIGVAFALVATVPGTYVITGLFQRRSTALGAYFTLGALGGVAGPLAYRWVEALFHTWRAYWVVFLALAMVSGLFAVLTTSGRRRDPAADADAPEAPEPRALVDGLQDWSVRQALATPQFHVIVGGYTAYLLVNTTTHGFGVQHLIERGVSPTDAGLMMSLEAAVGAAVGLVGGLAGEKVSPKALMIASLVAVTLGGWGLAEARSWPLMTLYVVGVGIGFGLSFLSSTMLLLSYFGRGPNLQLFSLMCMISTSAAAGPLIGGRIRDLTGSFHPLMTGLAAVTLALLVCAVLLRAPVPRARRAESSAAGVAA